MLPPDDVLRQESTERTAAIDFERTLRVHARELRAPPLSPNFTKLQIDKLDEGLIQASQTSSVGLPLAVTAQFPV